MNDNNIHQASQINADSELETMRNELSALKRILADQKIINECLMRNAVANVNAKARRQVIVNALATIFVGFCIYMLTKAAAISLPLGMFTMAMMIATFGINAKINLLTDNKCMSLPIAELQQLLARRRRHRRMMLLGGMATVCVWLVWFDCELYVNTADTGAIWGSIAGLIIGVGVGVRKYFTLQKSDKEMVRQLDQFTRDE